jgi:hypothetical protein
MPSLKMRPDRERLRTSALALGPESGADRVQRAPGSYELSTGVERSFPPPPCARSPFVVLAGGKILELHRDWAFVESPAGG